METISIIGIGYVGLPLAILASNKGYIVYGIDLNKEKVKLINNKKSPFKDKKVASGLKKADIIATTDFSVIKKSSIVIICVPTPVFKNRHPNYKPLVAAAKNLSRYLQKGQLVILESTVNPGVSDDLAIPILEKGSGLMVGRDFYFAHCPERINPGDTKWDVSNIPRVVGGAERKSLEYATHFYKSILSSEIKPMGNLKEAEAVKVVENSFRNVNIAFVNELAQSFNKLGIDVVNVINGAATKPFSFMPHYPGCGVGGHCIPVDPYYLIDYAKKNGYRHRFLALSLKVNEEMPSFTVGLLKDELKKRNKSLKGSKVAVLGLAYKRGIDDTRESPSFEIIHDLSKKGANVQTFDPYIPDKSSAESLDMAIKDVDGVIVATDHDLFKNELTKKLLKSKKVTILIDGRNCLNKSDFMDSKIIYRGIGR